MTIFKKHPAMATPISLAVAGILLLPLTSIYAIAQSGALEEIIVTARKREENLQETPLAVTAMSGQQLNQLGLNDIRDLTRVVPNLTTVGGSAGVSASPFIRGVGARNTGANFDGGVAIYLDGVYVSRPDGNIMDSVDIQNVQVLRGPQGTLFGKNATGGAILYATNKPTKVFEGNAQVDVGNYGRQDGQVTVNVPLSEDLLYSRLSLYSTQRDGLMEDQFGNDDFSNIDRHGGQLQFRTLAGDSVVIDLNGQYTNIDQNIPGNRCKVALGVPGAGWQAALQDEFIVVPSTGMSIQEHCAQTNQLGRDEFLNAIVDPLSPKSKAETGAASATVAWDINDALSLKSISAWRNIEAGTQGDIYNIGIPLVLRLSYDYGVTEPRNTDWYSQEFQLTGSAMDDQLNYVVGLFAANEKTDAGTSVGVQGPFFGTAGVPNLAYYTGQATELLTDNTSYAAFTQTDWAFSDAWNLTLGLRYTWEERSLNRNTFDPDVATLSTGAPAVPVRSNTYIFPAGAGSFNQGHGYLTGPSQENDVTNSDWNPMGSIQYLFEGVGPIDTGNAYFTIATGFLSGGLSESLDLAGNIPEYDPEEVVNYELGAKLDALENTLRFNTALFYTDYQNRQLTSIGVDPDTGSIVSQTINAKDSSIAGLEVETIWYPVEQLELTLNFAVNEGDIKEFEDETIVLSGQTNLPNCTTGIDIGTLVDICPIDRSDEDLPNLPKQSVYVASQYTWDIAAGEIIARLDASYAEDINTCFDYASCAWRDGKGLEVDAFSLGARLTWLSPERDWRVSAWGYNLTDYDYQTAGIPLVGTTQTISYGWNEPRTYGVELAYTW